MNKDRKAQQAVEEKDDANSGGMENPSAGPHAKDHLTDKSKTPGTGSLPDKDEGSVTPGSG